MVQMPELERECWRKGTSWVDEDKASGTSGLPGHWETGHAQGLPAASRMTAGTKRQRPEVQPVHLGVRPDGSGLCHRWAALALLPPGSAALLWP